MAVLAGRYQLGPDRGRILLRTFRDGLAAQAGHDLTIEATRWSGVLEVNGDRNPAGLDVRIDMGALVVREGTGGVKPLTDRDRREIAVTARKVLASDRHPEAVFAAAGFEPVAGGGGEINGTLTIRGQARPLALLAAGGAKAWNPSRLPLMGGMPVELGWSSLELFKERVLPRIRPDSA